MTGRPPKTQAAREADGDTRKLGKKKFQADNARRVQMPPGAPEMPDFLDKIARKEWERLVPILMSARVLTEADGVVVGQMCQAYSRMHEAERLLARTGVLVKDSAGKLSRNPLLKVIADSNALIFRCAQEYGMTAVSRSRITVGESAAGIATSRTDAALARLKAKIAVPAEKPRELKFLQ